MKKNIFYRPEIDGLRAISILSVLIYHLEISFGNQSNQVFAGGYIGVDIFFVISGYLITYLILKDLNNDNFSFSYFFQRRVRRILPVLLVVIFLTSVLAWFILLPGSLENFSKSTLYTIFFNSNFYFWHDVHLQYSHEQTFLHPLLHTWSLAIEEQYYIIFPIVIIFLIGFLKKYTLHILIITALISLFTAQIFVGKYPSFVFYIIPFRIWEILVGSICAYVLFYKKKYILKKDIFALIGFVLILSSFFLFNENTPHPSVITLMPIVGVASIILFYDSSKKTFLTKILSNSLMVRLGLISYSLYLVHFPIFSLARRVINFDNINIKLILLLLSFVISIFFFKFIEKPFRKKTVSFKKVFLFCFIFIIAIIVKSYSIILNNGYVERLKLNPFQQKIIIENKIKKIETYNFTKSDIIVIGNSHAIDFEHILNNSKDLNNKNISKLNVQIFCLEETVKNNSLICERSFDLKKEKTFQNQIKFFEKAKTIVLKTRWSDNDIIELEKNIIFLKKLNKRVIVIGPNPEFLWKSSEKKSIDSLNVLQEQFFYSVQPFDRYILLNKKMPTNKELEKMKKNYFEILNLKELNKKNKLLSDISSKNNVKFVNLSDLVCKFSDFKCDFFDQNLKKIYRSHQGHFTQEGINYLSKLIDDKIELQNFL